MKISKSGFTIVELLIVIVVIAILAAISVVAYNGIQERARFTSMRSDIASINKAIQLYYADNGSYPITPSTNNAYCSGSWCGWDQANGDNFIPGLSPKYIATIPQLPASNVNSDTYLYRSPSGTDYKLIRLLQSGLQVLEFIYKHRNYLTWVRSVAPEQPNYVVASKPELVHLLDSSPGVLSADEKTLIISSLSFEQKTVQQIMTPRSVVDTISKHEILGPLVLDALHKTGHSRFPVIDGDIDHIKGVLYLRDVLTVDSSKKSTAKVESAMSKKVFYIRQDHTLHQALSAFLRTHHHLFIVINEFHETVGIITLEDTLEALLGRKIIDEFDAHDDMRAVANRQATSKPLAGTEV